jgi:large subunit ribosomal protein L9
MGGEEWIVKMVTKAKTSRVRVDILGESAYMSRSFFEKGKPDLTMATVDVILKEKIEGLGAEADVVKVKRGYARNFLVPQGRAYEATKGNLRHVEHLKEVRAKREAEEIADAENAATRLKKLRLSLELAVGQGGKAFGSITTADIADLINEKSKLDIDRHQLLLDKPIKSHGSYDIPVKLHPDVEASVTVRVKAPEEEADTEKEEES